jgi:hypothetical protein
MLRCAVGPACWATRADLGSRGCFLICVKELEGNQQTLTPVSKPRLL